MISRNLKKYLLLALLVLEFGTVTRAEGNLPYVDQKIIHFGFLLGVNAMDFNVTPHDSALLPPCILVNGN